MLVLQQSNTSVYVRQCVCQQDSCSARCSTQARHCKALCTLVCLGASRSTWTMHLCRTQTFLLQVSKWNSGHRRCEWVSLDSANTRQQQQQQPCDLHGCLPRSGLADQNRAAVQQCRSELRLQLRSSLQQNLQRVRGHCRFLM